MGIGGEAEAARARPAAALRLERTRTMRVFGRAGVFWASMSAWRLVPASGRGKAVFCQGWDRG